jgi:plastocyanin
VAPSVAPASAPPPSAPAPTTFTVHANHLLYSTDQLTARTGSLVTVHFFNDDAGEDHHIEFGGKTPGIFPLRDLCKGPCTDTYTFVAPASGSYEFFCVAHEGMVGTLTVTP